MLDSSKTIIANLLAGNSDYTPNYFYIEFDNSGSAVTPGTFSESNALGYYQGLTGTSDYIKIPITIKPTVSTDDDVKLSYTIVAPSTGTGVHNKDFSSASSSRIYAVALVSLKDSSDPDSAVILSRNTFSSSDQLVLSSNTSVGFTWDITL